MITAPRIFSTGTILYGAQAPIKANIDSVDDARAHLRRMKAVGAFSVKSYNQPRREQRQQVVAAARELGMMVVPEGGSLFQHNMTHGRRRTHRGRARDPGRARLRRRAPAVGRHRGRLHADARGRLRRALGRELLVRGERRVLARAADAVRAAVRARRRGRAGGSRRRRATGTTSRSRSCASSCSTPGSRSRSARTGSARGWPRTGSCGAWCRAG